MRCFHILGDVFNNGCCKVIEENSVESSERCMSMEKEAKSLLDTCTGGIDGKAWVVDSFSNELISTISKCLRYREHVVLQPLDVERPKVIFMSSE